MNQATQILCIFLSSLSFSPLTSGQTVKPDPIEQGLELFYIEDYAGAIKFYKKALRQKKHSAAANAFIAACYYEQKAYNKAIKFSERTLRLPQLPPLYQADAFRTKANSYMALKQYDTANQTFEEALKHFPKDHFLWYDYGEALAQQESASKALWAFQQATSIHSDFAQAWISQGEIHTEIGKQEIERRELQMAVGSFQLAIETYREVLLLRWTNLQQKRIARKNLGVLYGLRGELLVSYLDLIEEGIADLEAALVYNNNNPTAYRLLGLAYAEQGDDKSSIENLEKALQFSPNDLPSLYYLEKLYTKLSKHDPQKLDYCLQKAETYHQRWIKINPNYQP